MIDLVEGDEWWRHSKNGGLANNFMQNLAFQDKKVAHICLSFVGQASNHPKFNTACHLPAGEPS